MSVIWPMVAGSLIVTIPALLIQRRMQRERRMQRGRKS